ncbi:choline transporter-like protein 4 [Trichonephila clavipes]|nr:choline transporter-like protein 4 [Trichonephila clavipes]
MSSRWRGMEVRRSGASSGVVLVTCLPRHLVTRSNVRDSKMTSSETPMTSERKYGEELTYDPEFRGPIKNRSCTDVICLFLFVAFLGGWCVVAFFAYREGDPRTIVYPTDSDGNICGVGEFDLELFFMNSVASTLNRVTGMEFNNQISVLTPNNWNTWKHDMQVLLMHYGCWQFIIQTKPEQPDEEATYKEKLDLQLHQFFGTKYQPGEDVGIFISHVKTAATRLQEAGHKLDDLYIGFQLIRWLPQEFQSTVQQIYRWKEEDFRVVKIEAELILEANRLQLMKQDLEKAENAYLSSFTSKKSKTLPGATAAAHGDPNGKNDYQKKSGKVFNCKTIKNVKQSIKTIGPCYVCNKYGHLKVNCKEKKSLQKSPSTVNETFNTEFNINLRFCEAECSLLELEKQLVTSCILFEENSDKGVWVIDTAATSHFCNDKSLFLDLKPITNMKMSLATEDKSCPVEGIGTLRFRVKYKGSFHEITLTDVLFNPKLRRNLLSGSD